MNKDQIKGKVDNIKGRIKEAIGTASGDKRTEGEGLVERVKGAVEKKVGDIKHALHRDGQDEDKRDTARREDEIDEDLDRRG